MSDRPYSCPMHEHQHAAQKLENRSWVIQVRNTEDTYWLHCGETWFVLKYDKYVTVMKPRTLAQCVTRLKEANQGWQGLNRFQYRILNVQSGEAIPGELFE